MPQKRINLRRATAKGSEIFKRLVDATGLQHESQEIPPALLIKNSVFFKATKRIGR